MPLTNIQKNTRHRAKVKAKLALALKHETALRQIADLYAGLHIEHAILIARNALNPEAEA